MSEKFEMVKEFYDKTLWSKERVKNAVGRWITKDEYELITEDSLVE